MTAEGRALGFWAATALVVGNMIGSGIFLLPASLAPLGWNAVFGWLFTIAGGLAIAWTFARLATALPDAPGPYGYTRAAFGEFPAYMVAWSYWVSLWVGNAAIAVAGVSYLSALFPAIANSTPLHISLTLGVIWLLTLINCRGVKLAGQVQIVTTVLKMLPLIMVMLLTLWVLATSSTPVIAPFEASQLRWGEITAAATLCMWGLLGLESATVPSGKVKDAARTIPRATMFGTSATGIVYLVACSAIILMMPPAQIAASNAPFADFADRWGGGNSGHWLAAFAAISCFGALNGWILLQAEIPFAMARQNVFPRFLGAESKQGTPVRAHLLASGLMSLVVLMNYSKSMAELFKFIILVSTSASLVMYLAVCLAALRLHGIRTVALVPLSLLVAALAVTYSVWTIYGAGSEALIAYFWLILLGALLYLPIRFTRAAVSR